MRPGASDLRELAGSVAGELRTDAGSIAAASADASGVAGAPDAVLRPAGPEDLLALVQWARPRRVPVVARGAGTSLDGESVPVLGGVVVDFLGWDRILEIDATEGLVRVQPGVPNRSLDRELRATGWSYPPNPGSGATSTIGGNVATNASGPRSYRYGATRAWVAAVELVDGRPERWRAGSRVAKSSAGPELVGLLVGSEGTLGLTVEATLRMARRPERRAGLVLPIPDDRPLGALVREAANAIGPEGSALEYVDRSTAEALREVAGRDWRGDRGLLLAEVEGTGAGVDAALGRVGAAVDAWGSALDVSVYEDADRLWEIRGAAGPSLERAGGPGVREDVVVPLAQLDAMLGELGGIARRHGVGLRLFGHIGQGNLHPVFGADPRSPLAGRLREAMVEAALRLGGSISGEHGIGATKREALARQLGAPGVAALRALKASLDPSGILNPGKLLPEAPDAPGPRSSASPSAGGAPRTPPA